VVSTSADPLQATCPAPAAETKRILLGHGSGGQLSARLLEEVIVPALGGAAAGGPLEDAAVVGTDLVMSTDSFVVDPLFFPGGDIGMLAVHGTVNDLAMRGAAPVALALALVLEEGLPLEVLQRVVASIGRAAREADVAVVTGDTKVVGHGAADRMFITTTGIGRPYAGVVPSAAAIRPGDVLLLSGPIGAHGVTVLSARAGLGFEADAADLASDTQPLHRLARAMLDAGGQAVHALRDPTRGGVASALNELAAASRVGVMIDEAALPVRPAVTAACEMLGLDVLHVANEGCCLAFVDPARADAVLAAMRLLPEGREAVRVGQATADHPSRVSMRTLLGAHRVVDMLVGEQLPRIC
jgi:hydrogenase expression/formation protein HypE